MCVCVCVCERERERDIYIERERERDVIHASTLQWNFVLYLHGSIGVLLRCRNDTNFSRFSYIGVGDFWCTYKSN